MRSAQGLGPRQQAKQRLVSWQRPDPKLGHRLPALLVSGLSQILAVKVRVTNYLLGQPPAEQAATLADVLTHTGTSRYYYAGHSSKPNDTTATLWPMLELFLL